MLPAVSSGPLDPAWSPDGRWIAFSMRGDIWKVPADGGEAIAVTSGPAYHFEPAWSPDGARIAFSFQSTGNLEIGVVNADGGPVETIASHARVDIQPAWSRDGKSLFFVERARRRVAHLPPRLRDRPADAASRTASSPRCRRTASSSPTSRAACACSTSRPTSRGWCATRRPSTGWSRRGRRMGRTSCTSPKTKAPTTSASIPVAGGNPVELTVDTDRHEMSPTVSPDGTRIRVRAVSGRRADALHRGDWRRARERVAQGADHRAQERHADRPRADSRHRTRRPADAGAHLRRRERRPALHAGRAVPPIDDGLRSALLPHGQRGRTGAAGRARDHRGDSRLAVHAEGGDGRGRRPARRRR